MKLVIILLSVVLFLSCSEEINYYGCSNDLTINDGLLAYWSFDDSTANDQTGNGLHATLVNHCEYIDGKIGKAVRVVGDGVNTNQGGHIMLPPIYFNFFDEFSINLWIKEEGTTFNGGASYIFFGDYSDGCMGIFNVWTNSEDTMKRYEFGVGIIEGYNQPKYEVYPMYYYHGSSDMNRWTMFTLTYDFGLMKVYRNTEFLGSKFQFVNVHGDNAAIFRHWWSVWGGGTATRMIGSVDDVRIYRRLIVKDEIDKLYSM